MNEQTIPLIQSDAVLFGVLAGILGLVFYTQSLKGKVWQKFYGIVPALFLCYFLNNYQ